VPEPSPAASAPDLPEAVRRVLGTLASARHEAVLVGGCLRDLRLGRPVADWDVATSAAPDAVLALFPRAVPIGLRHGTVMVPTAAGPVDVTTFRGPDLAGDLARRDFTMNAMALAFDPPCWLDPEGGLADLAALRLRAVRSAAERLAEDPLRALRAVRLVAELGLSLDPQLAAALPGAGASLPALARERVRGELERILLAPGAAIGLALLRRFGFERALLAGPVAADAPEVVGALPADLTMRLAAWLRGRDAAALLARLRFPRQRTAEVAELVRHHPIEREGAANDLGRLFLKIGREGVARLLALREAELAAEPRASEASAAARARLAELRVAALAIERGGVLADGRPRLAIGGAEVMSWLGLAPGPEVGRAIRFLTLEVLRDPERNEPAALRALLETWRARRGPA
jgi:tRNA nucleotidyltransferase/poly(A) polymerase